MAIEYSGLFESLSPSKRLGLRPFCSCCAGGEKRGHYSHTKAKSRKDNVRNNRAKPKYKDKR